MEFLVLWVLLCLWDTGSGYKLSSRLVPTKYGTLRGLLVEPGAGSRSAPKAAASLSPVEVKIMKFLQV